MGWIISTRVVQGTLNLSPPSMNAATSQIAPSPDKIPDLNVYVPNSPLCPRGLLGANTSSSIGLKIPIFFFDKSLRK